MTDPTYTSPARPPHRPRRKRNTFQYIAPTLIFCAALLLLVILVIIVVTDVKDNTPDATTESSAVTNTTESSETESESIIPEHPQSGKSHHQIRPGFRGRQA